MPVSQICLFFSNSGGGHRSATLAVQAVLNEILAREKFSQSFNVLTDTVVEKSHPINRGFVAFYNYLLRHNQAGVKYYFHLIHLLKPNDSPLGYSLTGPYLKSVISQTRPSVVVAIHPMINQYLPRVIRECGLAGHTKLITIVTDPNDRLWRGWACPDGDLTIVPNELARNKLLSWGVPEQKLKIVGMPIHPDFIRPPHYSREDFRKRLGLSPERLTICINSGWAGGGNMVAIYQALRKVKREIQVVFLCGYNHKLNLSVSRLASTFEIPTLILPFHDQMSELMNAVDLMVTKAGGLTIFEAVARRLPMAIDMITEPMPQEAGNVDILLEAGLAKPVRKPDDIVSMVEELNPDAGRLSRPLPKMHNLDKTTAVYDIARIILDAAAQRSTRALALQRGLGNNVLDEAVPRVVGLQ
jgi:UDP-N-acetylglucosamine:LPS N-acetylglucosamine transferase